MLLASDCLRENAWICGEYVRTRSEDILAATSEHVTLTVLSVLIGVVVAFPLALLARRSRLLRPWVLGTATAVYTIPSLALFTLLLPFTGISMRTVVIGLVLYTLTILVRSFVVGLESVPGEVRDAALGMGYGRGRLLFRVEVPLALPTMLAGVRVAVVSTVAMATIGFVVGYGGLGNLISRGLATEFRAQILTASVVCVLLAVVGDLIVLAVQRAATPWARKARA